MATNHLKTGLQPASETSCTSTMGYVQHNIRIITASCFIFKCCIWGWNKKCRF